MRVMDPYDAYKYYMSMKLHFESDSYSAPKYNYKTSAKPQSFYKRRDKYHFAKLGKKYSEPKELINFLTAQFVQSPDSKVWVGDMVNSGEEAYTRWLRTVQSLSYVFEQDINRLSEEVEQFDDLFVVTAGSGSHPVLLQLYLQGEVTLETMVILDQLTGYRARLDKQITETIMWPEVSKRIRKYGLLLEFNRSKMRQIIFRVFTS